MGRPYLIPQRKNSDQSADLHKGLGNGREPSLSSSPEKRSEEMWCLCEGWLCSSRVEHETYRSVRG